MKIVVIGVNGQLGWELNRQGKQQGFDVVPADLPDFDITDPPAVENLVTQTSADVIINAAAYTAVDRAESDPQLAFAINRDGPAHLAAACAALGVALIHVSTDYVFDGTQKEPYVESDPISPLGVYGQSKAAGEEAVRKILPAHIMIRTAWLYGVHGNNFVKTMLRLGHEKEIIRVVSDQVGCPTNAADLAQAILLIAARIAEGREIKWGTYHYCGDSATSWHGFAETIFSLARRKATLLVKKVEPIATAEFPTPVKRPANSVLNCDLIKNHFGVHTRPWKESLAETIKQLFILDSTDNGFF
jgi:dTDP-4-dehydrorhamnose reductase